MFEVEVDALEDVEAKERAQRCRDCGLSLSSVAIAAGGGCQAVFVVVLVLKVVVVARKEDADNANASERQAPVAERARRGSVAIYWDRQPGWTQVFFSADVTTQTYSDNAGVHEIEGTQSMALHHV